MENATPARYDVELLTIGQGQKQLASLLRRVKGLSAPPETIVASCPCPIATNISGAAAKKLKTFVEQIGARVVIRYHAQTPRPPVVPPVQRPEIEPRHAPRPLVENRVSPPEPATVSEAEVVSAEHSGLPQLAIYFKDRAPHHAAAGDYQAAPADPAAHSAPAPHSLKLRRSMIELTRALQDKDWSVREHAIMELGQIPSNGVVQHLTHMLKDDAWRVRCTALQVLGRIGSEAAFKEMARCVRDDVWHVRYQAIDALSRIESDKVFKPILLALQDANWQVRQRAVQILGDIRSTRTLGHVITCLKDDVWHVRESAAEALAKIKSEKSLTPLIEALYDPNWQVRSMVISALREIGSEQAVTALIQALKDNAWIVHWKAAHALGKIGNTSFYPVLSWLKQDNHPLLREALDRVLNSLEIIVEPKQQSLPRMEYRSEQPYLNMIYIPAGTFIMGDDNGHDDAKPAHQVYLPEFFMDAYEVTNLQYKHFDSSHEYPEGMGMCPVVNVTWEQAQAYANWIGKRLPAEAEWEKAARGVNGQLYPWGNEFDPTRCNTEEAEQRRLTRIDQYPDGKSPFGVGDLFGNVLEWTSDRYKPYHVSQYDSPDFHEEFVVLRGTSWIHQGGRANCATRSYAPAENRSNFIGFRCVKDVE